MVSTMQTLQDLCKYRMASPTLRPSQTKHDSSTQKKVQRAIRSVFHLTRGLTRSPLPGKILRGKHWLECLSAYHVPKDRERWLASGTLDSFFTWERKRYAQTDPDERARVKQLRGSEREAYRVSFHDGKLYRKGQAIHTRGRCHNNQMLYVISLNGSFYAAEEIPRHLKHGSLLSGAPVLGAGEIETLEDGTLVRITMRSGHYRPHKKHFLHTLRYLHSKGVDLRSVQAEESNNFGDEANPIKVRVLFASALEYLASKGRILPVCVNFYHISYHKEGFRMTPPDDIEEFAARKGLRKEEIEARVQLYFRKRGIPYSPLQI